ncbi:hypothetical protein [Lysobacter gummosus]|uniref:hypothetical protein n=1 Tax=Lysobacter gummosus TaxID=262324 RepID=UPI003641AF92
MLTAVGYAMSESSVAVIGFQASQATKADAGPAHTNREPASSIRPVRPDRGDRRLRT